MSDKFDQAGDDADTEADYGFTAAVPDSAADQVRPVAVRSRKRSRRSLRRRLTGFAVVTGALLAIGGGYALLAPSSNAADTTSSAADIEAGRLMFNSTCITCHGMNLQGVTGRGPSLIGVGSAATYFQVSTGRMPVAGQEANISRKPAKFTELQTRQIAAYVQSVGGGNAIPPEGTNYRVTTDANLAEGGTLFRLNCASCHNFAAKGAPLSAGKYAPSLADATDAQIYSAMISGPEAMPVFSNNEITPLQKDEIITYIQTLKASPDPGGASLGRVGPISEGLIIWTVGLGALIVTILWIGAKS